MAFAIKTKVLLCITFLEDFSSHLTDTLITLKTDMQTQFWFKTLIVYTYSIIFYHILSFRRVRVSICNHQFLQDFFESNTQPIRLEVMCGILALFGLQEGSSYGEKNRHMSWATHGGLLLLWCEKTSFWMQHPKMLLDEGECFWCQQKFGRFCWHVFLEKIGNQRATSWNVLVETL